jgi:predicted phage terminase large subunit-like protein
MVKPDAVTSKGRANEMRERMQCLQALWQRQARTNPNAFMEYCFSDTRSGIPFVQQWFHEEWHHAIDTESRVLIVAPRSHGKTAQLVGRTIYDLGCNPGLRIKIFCANDGRAKERLLEVQQNIRVNPRIREVFPHLEPDPNLPWNAHKIYLKRERIGKDASLEGVGITSSATGGRADIVNLDDVVDQRNALSQPSMRKQIKQIWFGDLTQLLEPWSRVRGICTFWHKDDLNYALMANQAYQTLFYAINQQFGAIWPSKWSEALLRLRHLEIGSIEFNRAFRNIAVDFESQMINPNWFRYSDLLKNEEFNQRVEQMHFLLSYDTAGTPTGRKEQDYSAGVVGAVDEGEGKIYIIDAWHARYSLDRMAMRVNEEFMKYHPYRVLIEKVGQASLDEWVAKHYPDVEPFIKVFKPQTNKGTRLLDGTPLLERGDIIFSHHLDPNRPEWDPQRGSIIHELEDFGFAAHDDIVDAYSQFVWAARVYFLDRRGEKDDNMMDVRVDGRGEEPAPYIFF